LNHHEVLLPEQLCPPPFGDGKRTFCFGGWGTSYFGDLQTSITGADNGDRFEALEPVRQGVRDQFGALAPAVATGLALRHDHGSVYLSADFQAEITFFGMTSSPAFIRQPEGNGCIERFFRTLKEQLLWVRHFSTIEELRQALLTFKETDNREWLIERLGYRSPMQARQAFAVRPAA
jgi:hypothetical protein